MFGRWRRDSIWYVTVTCSLSMCQVLDSIEAPPANERRKLPEQCALRLAEQLVTPIERGAERPVTRRARRVPADQQGEAIVEASQDLGRRPYFQTRRRQLNRQRQPIQ